MRKKIYLGDSVYADFDGHHIVLTTENGLAGDPSNRICLEDSVFMSLVEFAKTTFPYLYGQTTGEAAYTTEDL